MLVSASPSLFPFVSIFLPFSSFRCSFPLLSRAVFRIKEGLNVKLSIHWFSKKIRKYTDRMFPFVDSFAVRRDNHFDFTTARSDPIQSDPIRSKELNKFDHLDRKSAESNARVAWWKHDIHPSSFRRTQQDDMGKGRRWRRWRKRRRIKRKRRGGGVDRGW